MADRAQIRDAFLTELRTLAGDYDVKDANGNVLRTITLDSDDIRLLEPEIEESFPQIVYDDAYEQVTYNGVGAGPDIQTFDADDNVADERWREYIEATFTVFPRAANESDKEVVYEALRRQFQQYEYPYKPLSDFHEDVRDISVGDVTGVDTGDVEQVIRGDELTIMVEFYREFILDEEQIEQIDHEVDADTDANTSGSDYVTQ